MKDVQEIFHGKMYRHTNQYLISEQNMDLSKNKFILFRTKKYVGLLEFRRHGQVSKTA